jgi:hypothetical protein
LPQGLPKKIEVNLLLTDLGFELCNVFASRRQICRPRLRSLRFAHHWLAGPPSLPHPFSPADPKPMAPLQKMVRINPKFLREHLRIRSRKNPLDRRKLELPAENAAAPSLGHQFSPRERVPYILVSLLGCTPEGTALLSTSK